MERKVGASGAPAGNPRPLTHGATLRPLEKMVVRFGKGPEVVREQVVGRRHTQQREARGLAQQAAAARPLAARARTHPRAASAHAVQLIAELVRCRHKTNRFSNSILFANLIVH